MGIRTTTAGALALAALIAGCDAGPSARPARDHSPEAVAAAAAAARDSASRDTVEKASAPTPKFEGRPLWSANSKYSAEENAEYHFKRNGEEFDVKTVDAFVAKAHAFVNEPPKGAKTMTRKNGDRLIYDPKSNTFAVATKEGAPRTMFHPDNGADYWQAQVEREEKGGRG